MAKTLSIAVVVSSVVMAMPSTALAQMTEQRIVENSAAVFDQVVALHIRAIPQALLTDAEGVAIIPNVIKGGFILGGRHGKGVLLIRDQEGHWQPPIFISLTGGNIGWQAGVQSTDLVLVFKTRKSVDGILNGKLTVGADAAAAVGPVGRQAAAATDGHLRAEIFSYSRSRGLFAGVSVDGSVLRVEPALNTAYYGRGDRIPHAAMQLVHRIAHYCQPANALRPDGVFVPQEPAPEELPLPHMGEVGAADVLRPKVADAASRLVRMLDASWTSYLQIPAEVFGNGPHPEVEAVRRSLTRLDTVAADPKYATLANRQEFKQTHSRLRQYEQVLSPPETALQIPPPPIVVEPDERHSNSPDINGY